MGDRCRGSIYVGVLKAFLVFTSAFCSRLHSVLRECTWDNGICNAQCSAVTVSMHYNNELYFNKTAASIKKNDQIVAV